MAAVPSTAYAFGAGRSGVVVGNYSTGTYRLMNQSRLKRCRV